MCSGKNANSLPRLEIVSGRKGMLTVGKRFWSGKRAYRSRLLLDGPRSCARRLREHCSRFTGAKCLNFDVNCVAKDVVYFPLCEMRVVNVCCTRRSSFRCWCVISWEGWNVGRWFWWLEHETKVSKCRWNAMILPVFISTRSRMIHHSGVVYGMWNETFTGSLI